MKTLAAALLLALACPAFATGNHTPPPPKPPETSNHNQQNQGQHQGQGQAQGQGQHQGQTAQGGNGTGTGVGIGQGGNSDATATGGRSNATGGDSRATGGQSQSDASSASESHSGVQGSGNSQLDASDRSSYESNFMVQPNLPGTAPALVAGGLLSMQAEPGCGPLQAKVRIPVRMLVKRKWQDVGFDEDLVPYRDANGNLQSFRAERMPDGSMLLIGNNVTASGTVLGNASSSGVGIAGGGTAGYGQVSVGGGNGQQQIGMRYTIRECVKDFIPVKPVVTAAPRKAVKLKAVKRRVPAQCVPRAAKVCPAK